MSKRSIPEIEQWLVSYIANELKVAPDEIPVNENLVNLGLTSRGTIMLTCELEKFIDGQVDPALAWEHPTIQALSKHLGASDQK